MHVIKKRLYDSGNFDVSASRHKNMYVALCSHYYKLKEIDGYNSQ